MRRSILGVGGVVVALSLLVARPAAAGSDGSIGVYGDAAATETEVAFSVGVPRTIYVIASLAGQSANGMTAAEFRITGFPAGWVILPSANPGANVVLGDPFRPQGGTHRAIVAFPFCQVPQEGRVLLYTALVIPNSSISPTELVVEGGDPPSNPLFPTPVLTDCVQGTFGKIPVEGGRLGIRVRAPQDLDYSAVHGYDTVRGVVPQHGLSGDLFHFRVVYSNVSSAFPATGSPRLELDANEDGDALDAFEGAFTMMPADLDSTTENGKAYRFDVALAAPPSGRYRYRFTAVDAGGVPAVGVATEWNDQLFVGGDLGNLVVRAEDIRVSPPAPRNTDGAVVFVPVENLGDEPVQDVVVRIENVHGAVLAERILSSIGPRSSTEIAVRTQFPDFGFQPVVVRVDPAGALAESSEEDNIASHGVYAGGGGVAGLFQITGVPPVATVSPVAPFTLSARAEYAFGTLPRLPVSGARVVVQPSWDVEQVHRTEPDGSFHLQLTAPAQLGTHTLAVTVDDGSHSESTMMTVQLFGNSSNVPHAANLTVQMTAALGAGCPANQAIISWSITNHGDRDAAATTARLLDGGTLVTEVAVGPIVAGATVQLANVIAPLADTKLHVFTAHADASSILRELREDDNVATAGVRSPVACMDLAVAHVRVLSEDLCLDAAAPIEVRIENRGCVDSQPARLAARSAGGELASVALAPLAAGESATLVVSPQFALGCHDFELVLDPDGTAGSDCDAESNLQGAAVCPAACPEPTPPPPPDLRVLSCDLHSLTPSPTPGEPVFLAAWVSNVGNSPSTLPASVQFDVNGDPIGPPVAIGPLAPGERALAVASVAWPANLDALQTLRVVVDSGQLEWFNDNNVATRTLPYAFSFQSIPNCAEDGSMFPTCGACLEDSLAVRVQVVSSGVFAPHNVPVEFRDGLNGPVLGSTMVDFTGVTCGDPTVEANVQVLFGAPGAHQVVALVDPQNRFAEFNEFDNRYNGTIQTGPCLGSPDLVATWSFLNDTPPPPGTTVTQVRVHVTNQGTASAYNVTARLNVDGTPVCAVMSGFGLVHPGQTATQFCTAPWVVSTSPCTQQVQACADPIGTVAESNEANNCTTAPVATGCVDIPDLTVSCAFPGGTVPPPGATVSAVEVRVANNGTGPAHDVTARLRVDGTAVCELLSGFGTIAPGQAVTRVCDTPWVVSMTPCTQQVEACADPLNAIAESNESNNCVTTGAQGGTTDLALLSYDIDIEPSNPQPGQPMHVFALVLSADWIAATCRLTLEWAPQSTDDWQFLENIAVSIPAGATVVPIAFSVLAPAPFAQLRFTLRDVCPTDRDLGNNEVVGSLPWFDQPNVPVAVSDLGIESTDQGVRLHWRAAAGAAAFDFDRRRYGTSAWQRLPEQVPADDGTARSYEFIDRSAPAGERLEYRLVVREPDGGETIAGVVEVTHTAGALRSRLESIAPQPFRNGGRIAFALRDAGSVDLSVYDSAGRRVAVLRQTTLAAGRHTVTWDGRDSSGRQVPAGVYFCRFVTAGIEQSRRIVLVQ